MHVQHGGAAIAPLETDGNGLEEPRQHERERLEAVNRPFELERRFESLFGHRGDERVAILTAGDRLPEEALLTKPGREIGGWKRREVAQRFETPRSKRRRLE